MTWEKGGCDEDNAREYIKQQYLSKNREERHQIYCHYVTSTNTDSVRAMLKKMQEFIESIMKNTQPV